MLVILQGERLLRLQRSTTARRMKVEFNRLVETFLGNVSGNERLAFMSPQSLRTTGLKVLFPYLVGLLDDHGLQNG